MQYEKFVVVDMVTLLNVTLSKLKSTFLSINSTPAVKMQSVLYIEVQSLISQIFDNYLFDKMINN